MSDHSDEEEDFHPTTQEDIAVLNMAIANANTLVGQRLAACSGSSAAAFTYEWLSQNSEVLWLKRKLQLDFNEHPDRLYRAVNFIDTWAIDPDIISDWTLKQAPFWAPKAGKTQIIKPCCCAMVKTVAGSFLLGIPATFIPALSCGLSTTRCR